MADINEMLQGKDNSEMKVPDELLKRSGLKQAKMNSRDDSIILPKDVITGDEKFNKLYSSISSKMGIHDVNADQFVNLFSYYITSVLESKVSDRLARYDQMDFIVENDGALSMAERVLVDEVMQSDVFDKPITVTAKNAKVKQHIENLFRELGIVSLIPETAKNIIRYGDGFWILDIVNSSGVQAVIPTDVRDVRHRFEFSISDLQKQKNKLIKRYSGLQAIIDLGANIHSGAGNFRRVLLGFQIINSIFPFWQVLHFRKFSTRQTLFPFGKPFFYESQSEARMYLNAKVITSMIRASAFLKEHVKVKTSDDMDPSEQWALVHEVKQMMELFISRNGKTSKDIPSFGEKLYYPEGLISVEKMEGGFNFRDRFEDLDMMREDVFNSLGMPKGYFSGEGQYVSAKSLMMQDKKTARMVYDIQRIIISQLIKLVEVHFSFTKEFDPYTEDYAISLPYPIPDIDENMLNISSSKMQYATSMISSLKEILGVVKIPEDVIKKILVDNFKLSDSDINALVVQMRKDSEKEASIGIDRYGAKYGDPFLANKNQADLMAAQGDQALRQGMETEKQTALATKQQRLQLKMTKDQMNQQAAAVQQPVDQQQVPQPEQGQEQPPVQGQPVETPESYRENSFYEQLYFKAIKNKPIEDALTEVIGEKLLKKGEEFISENRHYISNSFSSQDRNSKGVINLQEHMSTAEKVSVKEDNPKVKIIGIDVLEDVSVDQRYLKKEEKVLKMGDRKRTFSPLSESASPQEPEQEGTIL
jgi:hypothetical protein